MIQTIARVSLASFVYLAIVVTAAFAETKATLAVTGMTCSSCAEIVTKKLKSNADVQDVKVSVKLGTVAVTLRDGSTISDEDLDKLIADAGYKLQKVTREG